MTGMRGGNRRVVTGSILVDGRTTPTTAWLRDGRTIALFERKTAERTYSVSLTDGVAGWVAYRGDLDTAEKVAASWEGATARGLAITATIEPDDVCPLHGAGCEAWA